jgi:hypothetical protein
MNNSSNDYLIELAILSIAQNSNSDFKKRLARLTLDEMSRKLHGDSAKTNPRQAIYYAGMRNSHTNKLEKERFATSGIKFVPEIYDISFYSFVQNVMDKICWMSRKAAAARIEQEKQSEEMRGDNGIDYANEISDELYIDSSNLGTIREDVLEANRTMTSLCSQLASKLQVSNGGPLYVFAPTQLVDGVWEIPFKTNDWDEALDCMNQIAADLQEQSEIKDEDLVSDDIDWAA